MSIVIDHLSHIYTPGTPFEFRALDDVCAEIEDGDFLAIMGHTGSGKTTLIQHFNGLLAPTTGSVSVNGIEVSASKQNQKEARKLVGMVFQYPEYQLFEETVEKDVAFGPKNMGLGEEIVKRRVEHALSLVGLQAREIGTRSPFDLSGGQRRRVAIAGVLAMEPSVLILDEPTAGLDPKGRREILELLYRVRRDLGTTIIMVSHNMDEIAAYADHVMVMHHGKLALYDTPRAVFAQRGRLLDMGLDVPSAVTLTSKLAERGVRIPVDLLTADEVAKWICEHRKEMDQC